MCDLDWNSCTALLHVLFLLAPIHKIIFKDRLKSCCYSFRRGAAFTLWAGNAFHYSEVQFAVLFRHLIKSNCLETTKINLSSVANCYYLLTCLWFCVSPARLRDSQSDWAARFRHHEPTEVPSKGPFEHRQCNVSPCGKHYFYFWHHKTLFFLL